MDTTRTRPKEYIQRHLCLHQLELAIFIMNEIEEILRERSGDHQWHCGTVESVWNGRRGQRDCREERRESETQHQSVVEDSDRLDRV